MSTSAEASVPRPGPGPIDRLVGSDEQPERGAGERPFAHVTGLHQVLSARRERCPALQIENCVGGGNRLDLGPASVIDSAVASFRQALGDPQRTDVNVLARQLDAAVMQPVRGLAGAYRHLLISPDGTLNLIPFEALRDEGDRYTLERLRRMPIDPTTRARLLAALHEALAQPRSAVRVCTALRLFAALVRLGAGRSIPQTLRHCSWLTPRESVRCSVAAES